MAGLLLDRRFNIGSHVHFNSRRPSLKSTISPGQTQALRSHKAISAAKQTQALRSHKAISAANQTQVLCSHKAISAAKRTQVLRSHKTISAAKQTQVLRSNEAISAVTIMDEEEQRQGVRDMFDMRSGGYDDSFHVQFAEDYATWADLKAGQNAVDLACGTGLVTFLLKDQVGQSGTVVGVDISDGMLEVAKRKSAARESSNDVVFINHDMSKLTTIQPGSLPNPVHLITCASALVFLQNPLAALKDWVSLMASGGRVIVDAPVSEAYSAGTIMMDIGKDLGYPSIVDRSWVTSGESLRTLLIEAGLVVEDVFETRSYMVKEYGLSDAFERTVASPWFSFLADPALKEKAKLMFTERFEKLVDKSGKLTDHTRFYVAIGRKE